MRKPLALSVVLFGAVVGVLSACSSSSENKATPAADAGGGGVEAGPGGGDTCTSYGGTIAKNAPNCGGIPDVAGTFSAACKMALDAEPKCKEEYKSLVTCQAAGAKCENGKIALGSCDAETAAFGTCGSPSPDAGVSDPAAGTWVNGPTTSGSAAMQTTTATYAFVSGANTFTWKRVTVHPGGTSTVLEGCTLTRDTSGTYAATGTSVTITAANGTSMISGCTDTALDKPSTPMPNDDTDLAAKTGQIAGTTLTVDAIDYTQK